YVFGRGNWVNMTTNPTTGAITLGTPSARRTPWYIQSDLSAKHDIKVGDHEAISFEATATNALNQHVVTAYWQSMDSMNFNTPLYPGVVPANATAATGPCYGAASATNPAPAAAGQAVNLACGALVYQELESGYNVQQWINGNNGQVPAMVQHGEYGKPYLFQPGRSLRFNLRFSF